MPPASSGKQAAARAGVWVAPCLLCLWVFWPGLACWFQQDDFAWLGLRLQVTDSSSLLRALFEPKAQGTIRPWSERVFFMGFSALFGLDALPYRLLVFATQMLNLWLLSRVAFHLTNGSRVAALAAPAIWAVNASLGTPLSWTSAYNQVLCAAFLLGAFLLWVRFVHSGRPSLYWWQFAVFLLGFGALEINVVYPAIAAAYALAVAPRLFWRTLPLGAVSAAYTLLHNHLAPKVQQGPYALHVDASMFATLATYWVHSFGGHEIGNLDAAAWLKRIAPAAPWVLGAALAGFAATQLATRRWIGLIGFAWFLAAIGPVLPLRDHVSDYYLTVPTIGLALAGGQAIAAASRWRMWAGVVALLVTTVMLAPSANVGRAVAAYNRERSQQAERFVFGVQRAREIHPAKVLLLTDVSSDLFWSVMNDKAFRLLNVDEVFLAPGAEQSIEQHPELGDIAEFVFPSGQVVKLLDAGQAEVYSASGGTLRRVTAGFRNLARLRFKPNLARRIEIGSPHFADQLGDGWYQAESGYRWMSRRASLYLPGPASAQAHLAVSGFVPSAQVSSGPIQLVASVDGTACGAPLRLTAPDSEFRIDCSLSGQSVGKERVQIVLEVDKVFTPPGDDRQLGLVVTSAGIRE